MDETATHFLLRLIPSLKPVGTIRAVKLGESVYRLRSLVVLKDYRQYGFGRELVSALHNWVKQDAKGHDFVQIISHSQIPVKGFYEKCVR
jgi:GNAT superfamily N-acetyltransferase